MFNALPQPDADIARFVRVTQAEYGMIDMVIADNYREDFKIQHFVSRVQKAFPGRCRWASRSLDEIAHAALPLSGDAPAHSVRLRKVVLMTPFRRRSLRTRKIPKTSNGHDCYRWRMPCAVIRMPF